MRLLATLLICLGLGAAARAETERVDMGGERAALFTVAAGWVKADPGPAPEDPALRGNLRLRPANDANVSFSLTFLSAPHDNLADRDNLRAFHDANCRHFAGGSVEGEVRTRDFKTPHGYAVQARFTDAALVGQPPEKENYKTVTVVTLYLGERVLVIASLFCDDPQGGEYAEAMEMLRSLRLSSGQNRI
jgi:hypothetical protein